MQGKHPVYQPANRFLRIAGPELFQVPVRSAEHPYRERELEVRVRDRHVVVEHPFDRFLWPRPILERDPRKKKSARETQRQPLCAQAADMYSRTRTGR